MNEMNLLPFSDLNTSESSEQKFTLESSDGFLAGSNQQPSGPRPPYARLRLPFTPLRLGAEPEAVEPVYCVARWLFGMGEFPEPQDELFFLSHLGAAKDAYRNDILNQQHLDDLNSDAERFLSVPLDEDGRYAWLVEVDGRRFQLSTRYEPGTYSGEGEYRVHVEIRMVGDPSWCRTRCYVEFTDAGRLKGVMPGDRRRFTWMPLVEGTGLSQAVGDFAASVPPLFRKFDEGLADWNHW